MIYKISGVGEIDIKNIVLDLNGTLSVKGQISEKARDLISKLNNQGFNLILLTGDQRGTANKLCSELKIKFHKCSSSVEKSKIMKTLDKEKTCAIGNARIDIGTFENARVSIATLQNEGIHKDILNYIDILTPSIESALSLLLDPDSFAATMRK